MRTKQIIFIIFTIIILLSTNILITFAATKSELQQQSNELQNKIEETEDQIDTVQSELSANMKQIQKLTSQILDYETQINDLDAQIATLEASITETQKKLDEAQAAYNEQEEMLKQRLVAQYESGETTYLDVLLSASSLTEFISNYYLVSEIAQYDTDLLNQMEKNKNEIAEAKLALETSKNQITTAKANKESTANSLKNSQDTKEKEVANLSEEEKVLQAQLDQLEQDNKVIDAKLRALASKDTTKYNVVPSSCGYIYPVPGYTKITTGMYYSWGGYHGAADFGQAGVNGQTVVAVKSGTVVDIGHLTTSYGNYVIINHHDGTYTVYAHGQAGSICVSEGQEVSQGQQLMRVGSTGNSTGPHLHFEVRLSPFGYSNRVYPRAYLP